MDFVKREDQNIIDEEHFKVFKYVDNQQKIHQLDQENQHAIAMEQIHQAMQSSMNSTIVHNLQLPLSPRQFSSLMLKSNQLGRNINFNDISPYLQRNLASEIDIVHNLANELPQSIGRHDDLLNRNMDLALARNLANELELQNSLSQTLVPNLTEQDLRISEVLPQNLRVDIQNDVGQEIDLSHRLNRHNIEQDLLAQERRMSMIQCVQDSQILEQNFAQTLEQNLVQRLDQNLAQRLDQNLAQRLDQNLSQRIDQNLAQRLDQAIAQRMGQRLNNSNLIHDNHRVENEQLLSMPFHIKSEQEDDSYFYDNINQGMSTSTSVNGINGDAEHQQVNPNLHQDGQIYSIYNNQVQSVPALNSLDLYARPQSYTQTYETNVTRDNPQNLVVHRTFENASPYAEDVKKAREIDNGGKSENSKIEQPKENLKPDSNKIYYMEFNSSVPYTDNEKSENDPSVTNKMFTEELPSMDIKGEYICYKCQSVFTSKRGLKQHTKSCLDTGSETEKLGKFCCTQCSYRCQSPAILKIHERTHTGEKPFSCTFCDYKSGQKNNVAKHILVHMKEKPFRCQYCNYRCAQKNNLVVHERTHTGYKPFACLYCDYRTVQKPNLVKHMYLHTDQKPFSCDQCSYRCVQKTNLTKHKQRHMNEKPADWNKNEAKPYRPRQKSVKCPHCTYRCVQKNSLDKHIMFKHSESSGNVEQDTNIEYEDSSDKIQNLSVKKDSFEECQPSATEPLQIQS